MKRPFILHPSAPAGRTFVRLMLLVLTLTLALPAHAAVKPNVLFIAIDDLNDWIGALGGHPQAQTPHLDRLAARGTLFTRAYCAAPACNPSRTALMTGIRPSTSGVYHNDQPWRPVMPAAVTLTQHFMAAGWSAQGGGKIFHGAYNDDASWQHWEPAGPFAGPSQRAMRGAAHFDWGAIEGGDEAMGDTHTVDWAIAQLSRPHDQPFFLAPGLIRPHLPFYAPQKYFDLFPLSKIQLPQAPGDDLADVPSAGVKMARRGDHKKVIEAGQWAHAVQSYLACISYVDGQIGRLIAALDASPHAQKTIVVLWSDHGWHLGEKQHWRKFALWEESTRVTFMIVAPGVGAPDQRCGRPVNLVDIYPTLVELCGLPPRPELEGRSLVPLLKNPQAEWNHASLTTHGRDNHALRTERWRYIRYADGSEELYDHETDANEWKNLAHDPEFAGVKAELAARLPHINAPDAPTERATAPAEATPPKAEKE